MLTDLLTRRCETKKMSRSVKDGSHLLSQISEPQLRAGDIGDGCRSAHNPSGFPVRMGFRSAQRRARSLLQQAEGSLVIPDGFAVAPGNVLEVGCGAGVQSRTQ